MQEAALGRWSSCDATETCIIRRRAHHPPRRASPISESRVPHNPPPPSPPAQQNISTKAGCPKCLARVHKERWHSASNPPTKPGFLSHASIHACTRGSQSHHNPGPTANARPSFEGPRSSAAASRPARAARRRNDLRAAAAAVAPWTTSCLSFASTTTSAQVIWPPLSSRLLLHQLALAKPRQLLLHCPTGWRASRSALLCMDVRAPDPASVWPRDPPGGETEARREGMRGEEGRKERYKPAHPPRKPPGALLLSLRDWTAVIVFARLDCLGRTTTGRARCWEGRARCWEQGILKDGGGRSWLVGDDRPRILRHTPPLEAP